MYILYYQEPNSKSVYIFSEGPSNSRWTLQQRLFADNDTVPDPTELRMGTNIHMRNNTLVSTTVGPFNAAYVFRTSDGTRWSQLQRLTNDNTANSMAISNPNIWGANMFVTGKNSIDIYSQYYNGSCLMIWMSDHFKDGWDIAVLSVVAPDKSNNTYHPHCDQVNPFHVRYCPYQIEDSGVYTVKVFAPTQARYFWEISYQVTIESTGQIYKGDFATKMRFAWDSVALKFSFYDIENPIDLDVYLNEECYRCMRFTQLDWKHLSVPGAMSFFPLTVRNAPYYVSDNEGRLVAASGKVSDLKLRSAFTFI